MDYLQPDSSLVLVKYEQAVRHEAERLGDIKEERMKEVRELKRRDEQLSEKLRLGQEPFSNIPIPVFQ